MDKNKLTLNARAAAAKRTLKGKPFPTASSLYTLGTSTASNSSTVTAPSTSQSMSSSLAGKLQSTKRDTISTPMTKKLKLLQQSKPTNTISGQSTSTISIVHDSWEEKAIEKDPNELIKCINEGLNSNKLQIVQSYLFGAVKQLKRNRDPNLYKVLGQLVKLNPTIFLNESVTEAFCSFLKKDPTGKLKSSNLSACLLAANLLYLAYHDEPNWPFIFIKVFIDDSLGDRCWVDSDNCKLFVDNLILAFNTKQPRKYLLSSTRDLIITAANNSLAGRPEGSSSPSQQSQFSEDSSDQTSSLFNVFLEEIKDLLETKQLITNRYITKQELVIELVVKTITDHLNRRQPEMNRNLVKLLGNVIGISSIRQQIVSSNSNRMEIWLQNPKISIVAQDLLLSLCINCNENDNEVIATLVKMRLKSKQLINQFVSGMHELVNQNENTLHVVLRASIQNEMSSNRNRNNMQLIGALFHKKQDQATSTLANLIKEMLIKDDCLKSVRATVREIMRGLKNENPNILISFVAALCENSDKYDEVDPHDFEIKERLFTSIADLISLCIFLCVNSTTKELISFIKNDRKESREALKLIQLQVSEIQRIAISWLQTSARKFFNPDRNQFIHCLNKVLLIESLEHYYKIDNWPPETDRSFIFRFTQEVPLLQETLYRLLSMGLSKEHFLQPTEAIEIVDALIRRAAFLYDGDSPYSLLINDESILKMLLKSTTYKPPENIKLPDGYNPPSMAISDWYWKVWLQILLITSHNPTTIGILAKNYPTLSIMIEMVITNCFEYPPPSRLNEELTVNEQQVQSHEKQQILQFESHLAAGSTKMQINETNSLLLSKLISFDPNGIARRPPPGVIEQLKMLNNSVRLGNLLCQSRNPDFLLEIIQRQQKQAAIAQNNNQITTSMAWLNDLVEMNSDNFAILPTQCLCEFVLGQSNEDELNGLNSQSMNDNSNAQEKVKRKEKRKKFFKLIIHFQNVLRTKDSKAEELIEYFMKRLSFAQSTYRQVVIKALSLILTLNPSIEDEQVLINSIEQPCDSRVWLIEKLSKIESFEQIKSIACNSLKDAILVESNPENVWNYISFLSVHTAKPDRSLILNLSRLLLERPILTKFLIQCEYYSDEFLSSCLRLFYNFLKDLLVEENKEIDSSLESKEYVIVKWTERNKLSILHTRIVHAMILLLTHGPSKEEAWLFEEFLEIWFKPPPQIYSIDTQMQITNFIPDWLKLRLIRSNLNELVDFAMKDLKVEQLVLFIQTFGLPVLSMNKLFSALDEYSKKEPELVRSSIRNQSLMKQLVEVEFNRGVKHGILFAELVFGKSINL